MGKFNIGTKIKLLRIERGLTQKELTDDQYSVAYLSRVESNEIKPSDRFIDIILKRLSITKEILYSQNNGDEINLIYNNYVNGIDPNYIELAYLKLNLGYSYSEKTYLKIYSILIRHYLKLMDDKQLSLYYVLSKRFTKNQDIDRDVMSYYLITCGNYKFYLQNFEDAEGYYTSALKYTGVHNKRYPDILYNISLVKQRTSSYNISIFYSREAFQRYLSLNDKYNANKTLITIGMQCYYTGDYKKSEDFLTKAYDFMNEMNDLNMISKIEYNLGTLKQKVKDYDQAEKHYKIYIDLLDKLNMPDRKIWVYRNLAMMHLNKNDLERVDYYLEKAKELKGNLKYPFVQLELKAIEAKTYKLKGLIYEYEKLMERVVYNCKDNNYHELGRKYAKEIGKHFKDAKKYKKSANILLIFD